MGDRTHEVSEKLNHLIKADEFVKTGGSYQRYAIMADIPRGTFYGWLAVRERIATKAASTPKHTQLVDLGKVSRNTITTARQIITIDYYGAKIEVVGEDALLALLKNIRAASNESL